MPIQTGILALLALLTIAVVALIVEVNGLRRSIDPLATSPLARALSGIGT